MEKVKCTWETEIFMKENGRTIKQMGKELLFRPMEANTQGIGWMINSMVMVLRSNKMDLNIKDSLLKVFEKDRLLLKLVMVASIKDR
jgi:hypothetical protein